MGLYGSTGPRSTRAVVGGMSEMGQSEKCRAVTYMSANRLKADVLGTKRFVAL
jgi:hypothetical protein